VSAHLKCNPQANGSGTPYADTIVAPWSYYKPTFGRTQQFDIKCPYGYVIGAIVGPAGGDPLLTASGPGGGPTKVMRWGTLIQNGMSGDPRGATTHYTVSAECISDNGQLGTVTAATDGNAAVQGDKGAVKVPSCAAAGKGHNTGKMHIDAFNDLDGTTTRVWETNAPTVDPNEPLCDPTKPGAGCKLEISIDGKPCTIGNLECEHWTQVDQADSTHTRVSCKHGPYAVALAVCAPLEGAYYPGGRTATQANTDGDPNTSDNTDFKGSPLPNNPAPQTLPGTGTTTGTTPAPGDAGQTSPSADSNSQECFPTGWGMFNPVEWVLKPLGCAFIPKTSQQTALQTRMQNITNTAVASPPFSWVAGIGMSAPHTAACPDWNIAIAGHSWNVVCDSSFTAALRGSRVAIFAMMATAMVWPLIRSIWYASIPFLRVAPGNHK
ncbi:hypothetical protein AB4Z38_25230, partial [Arthrobacter sp. 2RAF6]|uniref:hypothetical protein n=1 Tax=Arthrobacter sp. 2RAF6 TaxID=3233002 RepID=UPI003F9233D8